jgi:phosphatidylserine/phosphatidylglycerophosphate/cardiolipin synthase-like enzyme
MLELTDEPWESLAGLCKKHKVKHVDILTGFIGSGACSALSRLQVSCRLVLGLPNEAASLSAAQIAELSNLCKSHDVRWMPGLHAKLYVLDRRITLVGSANFTKSAFEMLDEILLATDDAEIAKTSTRMFESRWRNSRPLRPKKLTALQCRRIDARPRSRAGEERRHERFFSCISANNTLV